MVFEDKELADNVVAAVEKQTHYGSRENIAVPDEPATKHEVDHLEDNPSEPRSNV